jgi:hypothetical protein
MRLYLDIFKAVNVPNVSTSPVDDEKAARAHKQSFSRQSQGTGGDGSADDPKVGGKWGGGEPISEEIDDDYKRDSDISAKRHLTKKPVEEDTEKSEATETLDSLTKSLNLVLEAPRPNPREVEYLVEVKGEPYESVIKGIISLKPRERSHFNRWLEEKMLTSVRSFL